MGIASESGSVLPKAAVEKLTDMKFTTELPGQCGPYMMAEWTPKQKVVLKANPDWKGKKPAFGEVQFINIEDTSAAALAFEAGEVAHHQRAAGSRGALSGKDAGWLPRCRASLVPITPGSA